ncbi:MAG: SusC/RagA family TonB-linked outer membrane protein [Alistipes sp.]|nr:SusC/RagA family TonB-linked outer membrane protein [Alistipes sp.]
MKKLYAAVMLVALCIFSFTAYAQQKEVTGKVSDVNGEPLAGVTVIVKGKNRGTTTDAQGNYRISVDANDALTFSYIGYTNYEETVGAKSQMNVAMDEAAEQVEQVVVTGYQTISKERATGSFDIISAAQIEKPTGNIASRLIGAAAGLVATQDAYGNPTFEIRGRSQLSTSASEPLLVVDGFAIEGGFSSINPNDVESVTVLKDAAAASIWGAKSANGVIVVTTKNAKKDGDGTTVTVDYSGFLKVSPKMDLDYYLNRASTNDVIDYEVNNFYKWDASLWYEDPYSGADYTGGQSSVYKLLNAHRLGQISQLEMQAGIAKYRELDNTDQLKELFLQNPIVHQENVAVNIATDRSRTSISALYQNDRKHYKTQNSEKYMVSFRNQTNVFKWLDLNLNGQYSRTASQNNIDTSAFGYAPYEMIVDENGNYIPYEKYSLIYIDKYVPKEKFPYQDWSYNPLQETNNQKKQSWSTNARLQAGLTFKIWKGLNIESRIQYELAEGRSKNYYNEETYKVRSTVNMASTWDKTTNAVTQNLPSGGILDQSRSQNEILTIRNQVNFNHTFADKHAVAVIAGVETIDNVYQSFGNPTTYGYNDATLSVGTFPNITGSSYKNWQNSSASYSYVNSFSYTTDRYFSAFGNASYTYDEKYTVSGSVRTDASNLISDDPKYRYAPFWSVGASWQIGKEQFMQDVDWVDALGVRVTYGYNGNVDKSTSFRPLLNMSASPSVATNGYTATVSSYANPTLRWEKTRTWDAGVDFRLLHGKLFGKLDVYNKYSMDLIGSVTLPYVQGTSSMKMNTAEVSNKGFELEVGSALKISKNVSWTGNLMLAYNKNRIEAISVTPSSAYGPVYSGGSSAWTQGYDMNTIWAYKYGGLENGGTAANPEMKPTLEGKDGSKQFFNSWPSGTAENISYDMGTSVAPWTMAFSTAFQVYDFDISLIVTGKFGHTFMRTGFNYPGISGNSIPNRYYQEILNCDPNQMVPMPQTEVETRYYFWDRFHPYMSYLAENAGHIRLQELSVAYNLPKKAAKWLGVRNLKVYAQANNPFSIYFNGYKEDPEFAYGSMRLQASYTFGIKCSF